MGDATRSSVAAIHRRSRLHQRGRTLREGRYVIERRIGEGGMGVVYAAKDTHRDCRVALKTIPNLEAQALYNLKKEFRALQGLSHRNLISLGEMVEDTDSGNLFFTMELVDGVDFLSFVRPRGPSSGGPRTTNQRPARRLVPPESSHAYTVEHAAPVFDESRLRSALAQLVAGLTVLHEAGLVHRDVKPSNVLVTPQGRVVLLDFGLVMDATTTRDSTLPALVGTAAYMSPEQASSGEVGPPADRYALGALLYEALTGALPFSGPPLQILMDKQRREPPPPSARAENVPADLDKVCMQLLRSDPAERPSKRELACCLATIPAIETRERGLRRPACEPALIGREEELDALLRMFLETRSGRAVSVHITGESGIGKSAVVGELRQVGAGELPGAVFLDGKCYERESVSYKAFDAVIDALSRYLRRLDSGEAASLLPVSAALLPRIFPVLGRVRVIAQAPPPLPEPKGAYELQLRGIKALRELLTRLAERHPLLVAIDDLQWADADSVLLLDDIMREPDPPPLLLVLVSRSGSPSIDRFRADRRIELRPLPPATAKALAVRLLSSVAGVAGNLPETIVAETGGHPLFIRELTHFAATTGRQHGACMGLRLDEAIAARVFCLADEARQLLELVCVSDEPVSEGVLADAAGMNQSQLANLLSELRIANLLQGRGGIEAATFEPYHDRVRDAVLRNTGSSRLRRLRSRLAESIERTRDCDL